MGLDNAGKTTIINSYFNLHSDSAPTFGYKTHSIVYKDYKLNIVDVGGQYCFREYWSNYFEKTDGILFVVDCTDDRDYCEYLNQIMDVNVPICLMINKIDLNPKFNIENIATKVTHTRTIKVFPITVYDHKSIENGIEWLLNNIQQTMCRI